MRRRVKPSVGPKVPQPGDFRAADWKDPYDPIEEFGDAAFLRCVRRWLDAKMAWRLSEGRTLDLRAIG